LNKLEFNLPIKDAVTTQFADILLPIPLQQYFTYRIPRKLESEVAIGCRVIVQFGQRRIITGIIARVHSAPPKEYEAKYLLEVLDSVDFPSVNRIQLDFFQWVASYYMCYPGEVLNIGLPSGLKLSSESKIQLHPNFHKEAGILPLTKHEETILEVLEGTQNLSYSQVSEITGLKNIYSVITSLVKKESIIIFEEVKEKYKPKVETRIRLSQKYAENQKLLESVFNKLEKKPKQTEVLLHYLQQIPVYKEVSLNEAGIPKKSIRDRALSISSLNTLVKNGILEKFDIIKSRFEETQDPIHSVELVPFQVNARDQILTFFDEYKPVLLHGVTGSGKTEIYIQLIESVIESGFQALFLLPEIALTTQIVSRLKKVFGNRMGVYHSKFSDNERVEVWNGLIDQKFNLIVGVRSSIFLPFSNLGLIVIDEEHESSYKQAEPAPRYHARDSAMVLAKMHHAQVLLGSATPSLETYYQTTNQVFGLVELNERFGKSVLPEILYADVSKERKKKTMHGEFTTQLMDELNKTLQNGKQVIIFQNRRGYAPYMHCDTCGWIPKCQNCSVSLTYHLFKNELRCHYCGYREKVPVVCTSCGSDTMSTRSFGTEKLEEDLKLMFPGNQVVRMDLDTTRSKFGYKTILENFEKGNTDILVGTQMVGKGLDFENVSLVGIVDADRMIHFPNFRSVERTFQLITQVSGRAGRREIQGHVVIQTLNPDQFILQLVKKHDYKAFFKTELYERKQYKYPPYFRLISLTMKHKEPSICAEGSRRLYRTLSNEFGPHRTLGPQEALISKIRNMYIWEILIKFERNKVDLDKVKTIIREKTIELRQQKEFRNLRIIFDVDPY